MGGSAAVVGGGVGGLAVALGLLRAGWTVAVFERADRLPEVGTGLGIWPSALRALDRLGVGAAARGRGRAQPDGVMRRPDGSVIATLDVGRIRARHGEGVHLLSRPALLGVLAEALPPGTVRFGAPVADPVALTRAYDLVVGADGLRSGTGAALFGDRFPLRYAGVTAWRGTVALGCRRGRGWATRDAGCCRTWIAGGGGDHAAGWGVGSDGGGGAVPQRAARGGVSRGW